MSQLIVDGNEIIPGSIEVTTTNTSITPKDNLQVVLNINQVSSTAVVGSGTDLGMRMSLINKNSNACTVIFGGEGGTVSYTLALNKTLKLVWVGTYWIGTVGGVLSGIDNAGNSFSYNTETVLHAIPQNTQYTTEEVDTGMKWIDGKKIYRKTFVGENVSKLAGTAATVNWSISDLNLDVLVNVVGSSLRQYNGVYYYAYPFWSVFANNDTFSVQTAYAVSIDYSSQELNLFISGTLALELPKVYVTIYYTKTTD